MLNLQIPTARPLKVLCLGAHADDIEIGAGGTLLSWLAEGQRLLVHWIVFSANPERAEEARRSAEELLSPAEDKVISIEDFRESYFPSVRDAVKDRFEGLKRAVDPDVVFTHWGGDAHQDHRLLSELTFNTFRHHWILEYEIPKYDGDLGRPGIYVPLAESLARRKADWIVEHFPSQRSKHWFHRETFLGLMRLRGMECVGRYAEAFHCRKLLVGGAENPE